jgi:hypothetical protein
MGPSNKIAIELTPAESLVLFEFLARNKGHDDDKLSIVDQSEQRVLWDLECVIEKQLEAVLAPNYDELLQAARAAIRDPSN